MLDMGGSPSANSDQRMIRTVNASKNSKVQVVAFDFKVLLNINDGNTGNKDKNSTTSTDTGEMAANRSTTTTTNTALANQQSSTTNVDVDRIKQFAALLNVDLDTSGDTSNGNDDAGDTQTRPKSKSSIAAHSWPPKTKNHNPADQDIRAKYASKLQGGLAGIELAKSQVENKLTKGDAAGHLAARKIAMLDDSTGTDTTKTGAATRWLPSLEASQLLISLTHRSMRIVLLPILRTATKTTTSPTAEEEEEEPRMEDFKAQLKNVIIDKIIPKFDDDDVDNDDRIENVLRKGILNELDIDPNRVLLVSDRDPYLRAARDMGMNICKLQVKNARRGNITPHYTVETVGEVQEIVNEINGISFNTVLNR